MWRSTRKVCSRYSLLVTKNQKKGPACVQNRLQSSSSSGGSGKAVAVTAGVAVLGVGATLAYAKFDPGFRQKAQSSVPYGEALFSSILGPADPTSSKQQGRLGQPPVLEEIKEKALESSLLRKRSPVESKQHETASVLPPPPPATALPSSTKEKTPSPRDLELEAQKQLRAVREKTERQNFALEQSLREARAEVDKCTQDAVMAQLAAREAVQLYVQKLYRALDDARDGDDQFMWDEALRAKESKLAAVEKATAKAEQARKALKHLQSVIREGQENKETQANLALGPAEHAANVARDQLRNAESESQTATEAAKIATDYKDMIERARKYFQEEIEALLPDARFGGQGQKLSEDDLNLLVAHAHRRVELLTKALSKMQVTEQERAQAFQRQQERASRDLDRQRAELDATLEVKLESQREAFEQELQQQLRRQVAAHTEHLREALEDQRHDLDRTFGQAMERRIVEERSRHNAALAASVAKLQGMEGYLKARDELDQVSRRAKGLWLACQGLRQVLGSGIRGGPRPLGPEVQPMREVAPEGPYVPLVLAGIPEEALGRGVYPEAALKERFAHVERVCRRVALIDERGGSLLRYLVSYLQSLFVVYPKELPEEELANEQRVNPEMWDTFDVLSRVRYWLLHEDLEQALRYATQLRGEPYQVARDWIHEVRLHLEAKQAAAALVAFAAATIAGDVQ